MKTLVTGGGGFLGRAIVERLLARGDEVRSFARADYPELRRLGADAVRGDLTDLEAVERACKGRDLVFHVAAKAGIGLRLRDFHPTNVVGTESVIAACRRQGVDRLVFTSSPSVVFNGSDMAGADESAPYPPRYHSPYAATKAMAERAILAANSPDLATIALRPHLIWGPRDNHLVPRIIARANSLRRIGGVNKLVDSTYVDNAADAHLLAADRLKPGSAVAGRAYFISNGEPRPLWGLVNAILAAADLPAVTRTIPLGVARMAAAAMESVYRVTARSHEPRLTRFLVDELTTAHWFDLTAAKRDMGYAPVVSIEDGLSQLKAWLRSSTDAPTPAAV